MGKMTTVTNKWREMVVTLALVDKPPADIEASVFGCFSLHLTCEGNDFLWIVTHAPTGYKVAAYSWDTHHSVDVKLMIEALQAIHGDAWNTESVAKTGAMLSKCVDVWATGARVTA